MGKPATQSSLRWFEDLLFAEGQIFSFCRDIAADIIKYGYQSDPEQLIGEPAIAVVVSTQEEAGMLRRIMRVFNEDISERFGADVTINHEPWHYFLAYIEMKRISSDLPTKFFLSTQIKSQRRVESPKPHLEFDLRITTIKPLVHQAELEDIRKQIANVIRQLNRRSRYLKIVSVETGYAPSKAHFRGDPDPVYIQLPL